MIVGNFSDINCYIVIKKRTEEKSVFKLKLNKKINIDTFLLLKDYINTIPELSQKYVDLIITKDGESVPEIEGLTFEKKAICKDATFLLLNVANV
jgi:hypothetical protein